MPANRRRGAVTLCALITHKTDVQPLLPQLVLGNKRILPPSFCAEVSAGAVKFWSEASGWMTHPVLLRYLSLLTEVLHGLPQYQPVLIMDCAPAHMSGEILAFARDIALLLPGGCTGHIQPLDVGCFGPLKAFLRREARGLLPEKSFCPKLDWALAIKKAATHFLRSRRWCHVFQQCCLERLPRKHGGQVCRGGAGTRCSKSGCDSQTSAQQSPGFVPCLVSTLKVLGRGWRFHDFFGAQTGARKEGFLHVALTTLFNNCLPWHALGPCIHSLNRNRTDVTGKSVRIF